jgi:hypothetical protein
VARRRHKLRDRLNNDAQNNILIETRFSNSLKIRFPEVQYPALRQLVKEVNLPKSIANPQLQISRYNPKLELLPPNITNDDMDEDDDDDELELELELDLELESEGLDVESDGEEVII